MTKPGSLQPENFVVWQNRGLSDMGNRQDQAPPTWDGGEASRVALERYQQGMVEGVLLEGRCATLKSLFGNLLVSCTSSWVLVMSSASWVLIMSSALWVLCIMGAGVMSSASCVLVMSSA
jgi:hypothetical protein